MVQQSSPRHDVSDERKPGYLFLCFSLPWHILPPRAGSRFPETSAHHGGCEASPPHSPRLLPSQGPALPGGRALPTPTPGAQRELGRFLLSLPLLRTGSRQLCDLSGWDFSVGNAAQPTVPAREPKSDAFFPEARRGELKC